jgi:tetratricopeptide (TPR) repeat protein
MRQGRLPEAAAELAEAVRLNPSDFVGYWHLSEVRRLQGNYPDAIASCREALRVNPNSHEALNNMAWLLATAPYADFRNGHDAVRYAEAACRQSENQVPLYIGTLAAALAEAGRFSEATQAARRAIAAAEDAGHLEVAERNRELLGLYELGRPFHEPEPGATMESGTTE